MANRDPFNHEPNFWEDLGMFEAATHAPPCDIPEVHCQKILLLLDDSDRKETLEELARLIQNHNSQVICANEFCNHSAEIEAAISRHQPDLILASVPFARDYRSLNDDSLGEIIDQLLLATRCPILLVRNPTSLEQLQNLLRHCVVPIVSRDDVVFRAVAWAFRLLAQPGDLELVAVIDGDVMQEARQLLDQNRLASEWPIFDRQRIESMVPRYWASLTAAAQKQGLAEKVHVKVNTKSGRFLPVVMEVVQAAPGLVVWGTRREHDCPAFHRAVDLLLAARGPVLIV